MADIARSFGLTRAAVNYWFTAGKVPAEHVLKLEKETGVHRSLIRPDLYPPEEYMQ